MNRLEYNRVRRATNRLNADEVHTFPSDSNLGVTYRAVIMRDGKVTCDCRGWTIKKRGKPRWCKHAEQIVDGRATRADGEFVYVVRGEVTTA